MADLVSLEPACEGIVWGIALALDRGVAGIGSWLSVAGIVK